MDGWQIPVALERAASLAITGSAPMMQMPGRLPLAATAIPEINPPPPTGTTIASTSGTASKISSAMVPWPAMTSTWLYGGITVEQVRATTCANISSRAVSVGSHSVMCAPNFSTASSLARGALCGMTTRQGNPRSRAAYANACPWFPLECVATPVSLVDSGNRLTACAAPRYLKLPVR